MLEQKDIDLKILNDTIVDYRDQVQRLRECAERLQYETDAIPAIKAERDALALGVDQWRVDFHELRVERDALRVELNEESQKLVSFILLDHAKVCTERDALKDAARLALDALVFYTEAEADDYQYKPAQDAIAALKAVL